MNRATRKNSILVCSLLGVMVAGQAMAADIRYKASGDYFDTTDSTGDVRGWQSPGVPGEEDTARFNWGNNTVTLAGEAPFILRFQMGVDESGQLVVESGGKLTATGAVGGSTVGNNGGNNVTGRLTVNTNGEVTAMTAALEIGASANGILTVDGGTVNAASHLWVGSTATPGVVGTIYIRNGGVLNVGEMIGLGTVNAVSPSGARGIVNVQSNGVLNLANIQGAASTNLDGSANPAFLGSIQPDSLLDISGTGLVMIPGDFIAVMSAYTNAGRIIGNGGTGSVGMDYDTMNVGKTTLFALGGYVPPPPPTAVIWNPAANPSGTGKWNEATNWTGFVAPANVTKVTFNVEGAIPCTVTNAAVAQYIVMGDGGPGGILIITNGGSLAGSADSWSGIGYDSNALMVVEEGGSASFGSHLWIGLGSGSDGTLIMNGGTVSVGEMFGLGWGGGKGTAQINGGTLQLAQLHPTDSIKGESVLNVTGTGMVVINGDHTLPVGDYVTSGKITANGGPNVLFSFDSGTSKTTITAGALPPPPRQSVTSVTVSGGNVSLTYETTLGYTYHVEGTPGLWSAAWIPVSGSTNKATGATATFTFPANSDQMFYRTVSP